MKEKRNEEDVLTLEQLANEDEEKLEERVAHLRKINQKLTTTIDRMREKLGNQREFIEQVCGAVVAQEPYPRFKYSAGKSKTSSPIVPVIDFSDWHIGEVVNEDEVEGFNKFNWEIAQAGIFGIVDDFLKWVDMQRGHYRIEQCVAVCKGDYISGDIHDELRITNEFPLPVQTAKAGSLMGEVIRILAGRFAHVTVEECGADNHGRLQKKPQAKQKAQNNMSYLVHHIANAAASRCNNVRIEIAEGMKHSTKINGKGFLIEHGDTIKSHMGFPWYGLTRTMGREAIKCMGTNRGFEYYSIGHFHTPNLIEGRVICNGSLSGTSEFDHSCGRHAKPCQVAYMVHPVHGVFNFTPFVRRDVK